MKTSVRELLIYFRLLEKMSEQQHPVSKKSTKGKKSLGITLVNHIATWPCSLARYSYNSPLTADRSTEDSVSNPTEAHSAFDKARRLLGEVHRTNLSETGSKPVISLAPVIGIVCIRIKANAR